MTRIVAISDTHTKHEDVDVPECDILIHAGDFSFHGEYFEVRDFSQWLRSQPARHKIVIAGNHELTFDMTSSKFNSSIRDTLRLNLDQSVHYLEDSGIELEGLKFWGTPWTPRFFDWAFNGLTDVDAPFEQGTQLSSRYDLIPHDTDVLICHGPPYSYVDKTLRGEAVGSAEMVTTLDRLNHLKAYFTGHIHEGRGIAYFGDVPIMNVSSADRSYNMVHPPVITTLDANNNIDSIEGFKK
jgi:hypothetical protein